MKYKLNSIYLLQQGKEPERIKTYYYTGYVVGENELFNSKQEETDDYMEIIDNYFPLIKKNQFSKYVRENKSFLLLATFSAWDDKQQDRIIQDKYCPKVDLYLSNEDIEKCDPYFEEREYHKGEKSFILHYDIKLRKPIATGKAHELRLYKDFESVPDFYQRTSQDLKKKYEELRPTIKESAKAAYEKKIQEGYMIMSHQVSTEQEIARIDACAGVQRVEKSQDFKLLEKVRDIINSCVYSSNKLSINEIERITEKLNITIKRK